MSLQPIHSITGRGVVVSGDDIDTDRIIPARFLKAVTFDDLAEGLFYDERFDERGASKNHPLDQTQFAGASVLITGNNFGCGSSREHAPQSLKRFGIQAVIAGSYGEIFFSNATTIGLVCVRVSDADRKALATLVREAPQTEISVNVDEKTVIAGSLTVAAEITDNARHALTEGYYDPLSELLGNVDQVRSTAETLGYEL